MANPSTMRVASYIGLVRESEDRFAKPLTRVADHHTDDADVEGTSLLCAEWSRAKRESVDGAAARYGASSGNEPDRLTRDLCRGPRRGPLALSRDLQDLHLLAGEVTVCWIVLVQAAFALRDEELSAACELAQPQTERQLAWRLGCLKQAAPQALVVA